MLQSSELRIAVWGHGHCGGNCNWVGMNCPIFRDKKLIGLNIRDKVIETQLMKNLTVLTLHVS